MTPLSPETRALLRQHGQRAAEPRFSNAVLAEQFEQNARRGPFTILPRTDGQYALIDERRPVGERTVAVCPTFLAAQGARDERLGARSRAA